jgi:hypothetical protein
MTTPRLVHRETLTPNTEHVFDFNMDVARVIILNFGPDDIYFRVDGSVEIDGVDSALLPVYMGRVVTKKSRRVHVISPGPAFIQVEGER